MKENYISEVDPACFMFIWRRKHSQISKRLTPYKIQTIDRVRNENIVSQVALILGSVLTDRRTGNSMNTSIAKILMYILWRRFVGPLNFQEASHTSGASFCTKER